MLAGCLCLLVLAGALATLRARARGTPIARSTWHAASPRKQALAGALLSLAVAGPLLYVLPFSLRGSAPFVGDSLSHAHIARDLARDGLPHGWLETYAAGFPFGHHYPPLGWLLLAGTIGAGAPPVVAIHFWGALATLLTPLVLYFGLVRAGARPGFAALGGLLLSWVAPYNPFVGGYETFYRLGLFSQVVALPFCLAAGAFVARGSGAGAAFASALAMSAHPQLGLAALLLTGIAALAAARRDALERALRAGLAGFIAGAALYGQGIATLDVPFGWPPAFGWRQVGFDPSRLDWWLLDGDLLDLRRNVPALTALATAALLAALFSIRRAAPRAAASALVAAVLLSVSGPGLAALEPFGPALLTVIQPLRIVGLVAPLAAVLVVVALEEGAPAIAAALERFALPGIARFAPPLLAALTLAVLLLALPARLHYARELGGELRQRAEHGCSRGPAGYDRTTIEGWLTNLAGGRLWFDASEGSALRGCLVPDGLPLASSVAIGTTIGAGAHVGLHWLAFRRLEPERAGAERRAEALGIRHLLVAGEPPSGFTTEARRGTVTLASRRGGTDLVGAGCIVERWTGSDGALRERLSRELATPSGADRLLDPEHLVALDERPGPFAARAEPTRGCDATRARVTARLLEPGALEAVIETPAPVDVVFRATAFPSWRVTIDGVRAGTLTRVSPGFFATRVAPGRHRVVATASSAPGYGAALALGVLGVLLAGFLTRERFERAAERVARARRGR